MARPKVIVVIEGFDGLDQIYKQEIQSGTIARAKLEELLRCLVAKHGQSDEEIVSAFMKKGTRGGRKICWRSNMTRRIR